MAERAFRFVEVATGGHPGAVKRVELRDEPSDEAAHAWNLTGALGTRPATLMAGDTALSTMTPRSLNAAPGWDLAGADGTALGRIGGRGSFRSGWVATDTEGARLFEAMDPTAWSSEALRGELAQVSGGYVFARQGLVIGRLTRELRPGAEAKAAGLLGGMRRLFLRRDWVLAMEADPLPPIHHLAATALAIIEVTVPAETS